MKVFKMNECDWVAAESEDKAKEFYHFQTGLSKEEIEEDFEGESSIQETMLIEFDQLPDDEKIMSNEIVKRGSELFISKTFEWVINNDKIREPCIIASTEY